MKWKNGLAKFGSLTFMVEENIRKENDWAWGISDLGDTESEEGWHGHFKNEFMAQKAAENWAKKEIKRMIKDLKK